MPGPHPMQTSATSDRPSSQNQSVLQRASIPEMISPLRAGLARGQSGWHGRASRVFSRHKWRPRRQWPQSPCCPFACSTHEKKQRLTSSSSRSCEDPPTSTAVVLGPAAGKRAPFVSEVPADSVEERIAAPDDETRPRQENCGSFEANGLKAIFDCSTGESLRT
jgi:hypothetical protein